MILESSKKRGEVGINGHRQGFLRQGLSTWWACFKSLGQKSHLPARCAGLSTKKPLAGPWRSLDWVNQFWVSLFLYAQRPNKVDRRGEPKKVVLRYIRHISSLCSNQMRLLDQTFNQGHPFTRQPALTAYGVTRVGNRHFSISRRRIRKRSQPTRSATPATTSAP